MLVSLTGMIACEKGPLNVARGLERIQSVLAQDRMVATYKLALIRALCQIARTQSALVVWERGTVRVPLWSIAVQWLALYWPLLTSETFIAQMRGLAAQSATPLAFRRTIAALAQQYTAAGLFEVLGQIDVEPVRFRSKLKVIADAICKGPVEYAGTTVQVFEYNRPEGRLSDPITSFGWVVVPEPVWLDIARFESWIEDALIVRWARLTAEMNSTEPLGAGRYLPLLLQQPQARRDTEEARRLVGVLPTPVCVWTGRLITTAFEVDHMVPLRGLGKQRLVEPAARVARRQQRQARRAADPRAPARPGGRNRSVLAALSG
ncbi:MAG: hypothetical protein H7Z42_10255 [Roseiflexaceae bacterium]|nr:hypothetical protein [Roseiflexaceae bacterium]